jgi:hypothetical protein
VSRYSASGRYDLPQDGEIIGGCPLVARPWVTVRDPQALQTPRELAGGNEFRYDAETGALVFILREDMPSTVDWKFIASSYRKRPAGLTKLSILLRNDESVNIFVWLTRNGFTREEGHPLAVADRIAYTKCYARRHGLTD